MTLRPVLLALLVVVLAAPLASASVAPDATQNASLFIDDVTIAEGDSGSVTATFTVTLSEVSPDTVTVDYATTDGTAMAPSDYSAAGGTLTFLPGETTRKSPSRYCTCASPLPEGPKLFSKITCSD